MAEARFNPSHTVEFDFSRGLVSLGAAAPRILLPADLFRDLIADSPEPVLRDLGHRLGIELGRRVFERIGTSAADASIEGVVEHLGGELALTGLGSLGLERWGRALIVTIAGSPLGLPGAHFLCRVVEGALQRLFGRDVRAVLLVRDSEPARLLVVSPGTAGRVAGWLEAGMSWTEVLGRVQGAEASSGGAE